MKNTVSIVVAALTLSSYAFAADVNFDVNMKTKQGNSETSISVGNRPQPAPSTVVVKEKTVIVKEKDGRVEEHHDHGKKKGHYKEKHKKHKKHDKHDDERGKHRKD